MKKLFTVLLVFLMVFTFASAVWAQEFEIPEDGDPANEAIMFGTDDLVTKAGNSVIAERIRYIPIEVYVTSQRVEIYGYFVNMNNSTYVKNFRDFSLSLYQDGEFLLSATFGNLNSFTIPPLSMRYQSFTITGWHNLNSGDYICDDGSYAYTGFNFSSY